MNKDPTGIRSQHTKMEMLERETFLLKLQLSYYQDACRFDVSTKRMLELQVGIFHSFNCDHIHYAFHTSVSDSK